MIKYVPNILTVIRLFMAPLFIWAYYYNYPQNTVLALSIYLTAGITDMVDGYIARKYNCQSIFGRVLDPLADKLMTVCAFACLYLTDVIPSYLLFGYVAKELLMLVGAAIIFRHNKVVVKSSWYGKSATFVLAAAIALFIIFGSNMAYLTKTVISLVVLAYIIFAFIMYYLTSFRGKINKRKD